MIDPADHLGLVRHLAHRYASQFAGSDPDDIVGDGMEGLVRAAQRFDPARGVTFSTFAGVVILGYMRKGHNVRRGLRPQDGTRRSPDCLSLDAPTAEEGTTLAEVAADPERFEDDVETAELLAQVRAASADLPDKLRRCLPSHKTLRQIAVEEGVSYQAVLNRRHKAVVLLRKSLAGRPSSGL